MILERIKLNIYFEKRKILFKIMLINEFKNKSFMNENLISDNIENDEFSENSEKSDYINLTTRLKEISKTISLLAKQYSHKL